MRVTFAPVFALLASVALAGGCAVEDSTHVSQCAVAVGKSPTRGPTDARVTVVEFGDFQCPYCALAQSSIAAVDEERPGEVLWVWKHLPLSMHAHAEEAAVAAECANEQGKFWEMHDVLFANQEDLRGAALLEYADQVGLDIEAWKECLDSDSPLARVSADVETAERVGVPATPAFYVNGEPLIGARSPEEMLEVVDRAAEGSTASGLTPEKYYATLVKQGCP